MNESQYGALVARNKAQNQVNLVKDQLTCAVRNLKAAEEELQRMVEADMPSWYGKSRIET